MKKLLQKTINTSIVALVTMSMILYFSSCEKNDNNIATIKSITLTPDTVTIEETSVVTVETQNAKDDDVLYYTVNGGSVAVNKDSVLWTAPSVEGTYTIKVLLTDPEGNSTSETANLVVLRPDSVFHISGTVTSNASINLKGTKVLLYDTEENFHLNKPIYTVETTGNGNAVSYVLHNMPIGSYYMAAWKDANEDNLLNIGDYYGCYGTIDINGVPNPYILKVKNSDLKSVNIFMKLKK